jgi:hypothetical protein
MAEFNQPPDGIQRCAAEALLSENENKLPTTREDAGGQIIRSGIGKPQANPLSGMAVTDFGPLSHSLVARCD